MISIPGPILFVIYKVTGHKLPFSPDEKNLVLLIATFCFTMMGFLAAGISFLFSFRRNPFFDRYEERGHLSNFIFFYHMALLWLFITFIFSIIYFSLNGYTACLSLIVVSFINNLVQILFIGIILYNVIHESSISEKD